MSTKVVWSAHNVETDFLTVLAIFVLEVIGNGAILSALYLLIAPTFGWPHITYEGFVVYLGYMLFSGGGLRLTPRKKVNGRYE